MCVKDIHKEFYENISHSNKGKSMWYLFFELVYLVRLTCTDHHFDDILAC